MNLKRLITSKNKMIKINVLALLSLVATLLLGACGNPTTAPSGGATSPAAAVSATSTPVVINQGTATTGSATQPSTTTSNATSQVTTATSNTTTRAVTPASTPSNQTTAAAGKVPRFDAAQCAYDLPRGLVEGRSVNCGFVTVPEFHAQPGGRTIKLSVIILKSQSSTPAPEPIVYLNGGPGGRIQDVLGFMTGSVYNAFTAKNDAILFDQRGEGKSVPALTCPEIADEAEADAPLHLSAQESVDRGNAAAMKCHDRLVSQGVNLSAFNTAENAGDINDIRQALGYQKINLYGQSYGTDLAQVFMRLYPQALRSVVLDSVVPMNINADINSIVSGSRSLNMIFQACAADPVCNKNYPDLKNVFSKTFADLNTKLPLVPTTDFDTGQAINVKMDGPTFVNALFVTLYISSEIPHMPAYIYAAYTGNYRQIAPLLGLLLTENRDIDLGMYYSVECNEEWPFSTVQDAQQAATKALPELAQDNTVFAQGNIALCQKWNVKPADPTQHQPVKSDIPTLVMEGSLDPITPPEYGQSVLANLSHGFYAEFPGRGHGQVLPDNQCGVSIMSAFIANPNTKPDTSCTSRLGLKF